MVADHWVNYDDEGQRAAGATVCYTLYPSGTFGRCARGGEELRLSPSGAAAVRAG